MKQEEPLKGKTATRVALAILIGVVFVLLANSDRQTGAFHPCCIHWNMATPYAESSFQTINVKKFAADVMEATHGALEIKVFSNESLIKHPEIKSAVQEGKVPVGEILMSRLGAEDPIYEVDSVPFLARGYADARRLWDASKPVIEQKLNDQGLTVLFAVPWPPHGIYAKKELKAVDDLNAAKFRAYNTSTERLAQLLGADPVRVEFADIPTAFTNDRLEAMTGSPAMGVNIKAWTFASYFHPAWGWLPKNMVIVNKSAFDQLDPAIQKTLLDVATAAEARGWEASAAETDANIGTLKQNGIQLVAPSETLLQGLLKIGETMIAEWVERAGGEGEAILEAYRE